MNLALGKYIGIDLGTTFCCMAYINENGQPEIIHNSEGDNITPSIVFFDEQSTVVGKEARTQSIFEPRNCEQFVKRHMGERGYSFATTSGEKYNPEAISAIILAKLKADAERSLGDTIDGVVITVPAYFNEAQRMSTMDAGRIAGLNVVGIINEPTAAALAFGITKANARNQTVMVYDLGGGTFDVTIMRFDDDRITVLGTAGNRELGGYDFDRLVMARVKEAAAQKGLDISKDNKALHELISVAEAAKKSLSAKEKTNIVLTICGQPFRYMLTRDELNELIEPLLYNTISSMENARDEACLSWQDIDKILLVGGSTKMPIVSQFILDETGILPSADIHPDEAVAIGAAYHAIEILEKKVSEEKKSKEPENKVVNVPIPPISKKYSFADVISHGIGIVITDENDERVNSVILPKNSSVPCKRTNYYQTAEPFQDGLLLEITQGEETDMRYVTQIGSAEICLRPRDRLVGIEVSISCDENSIIHVSVFDQDLQEDLGEMRIDRISNLTEDEIRENKKRINKLDISGE